MKTLALERVQIGLLVAITLIGGGAWNYAILAKQVDFNTRSVNELNTKFDQKLDQLLAMKTDIEVIRAKVQAMERPVYHTARSVKALREEVAALALNPVLNPNTFNPTFDSPLGHR